MPESQRAESAAPPKPFLSGTLLSSSRTPSAAEAGQANGLNRSAEPQRHPKTRAAMPNGCQAQDSDSFAGCKAQLLRQPKCYATQITSCLRSPEAAGSLCAGADSFRQTGMRVAQG